MTVRRGYRSGIPSLWSPAGGMPLHRYRSHRDPRGWGDDPAGVDELVAAIAPGLAGLGLPVITDRREVVLVTGPWLAKAVRAALAE